MNPDWQQFIFAILTLLIIIAITMMIVRRQKPPKQPTLEDRRLADLKTAQEDLYQERLEAERSHHSIALLTARIARLSQTEEQS